MGAEVWFLVTRVELWLVAAFAYFCGCFNGAVIISKYILRDDVRNHGSGNAGLTNFYRTFGGPLTLVVILCDVLKAVVAILIAAKVGFGFIEHMSPGVTPDMQAAVFYVVLFKYWAALFCLLGHMFPCMFQFKGGKGILSGGTIIIMIDWRVALVGWGGFILLFLLTRYVSLGSSSTGIDLPIVTWFVYRDWVLLVLICIMGGLILWKHRSNIARLISGTESKFSFHRKAAG